MFQHPHQASWWLPLQPSRHAWRTVAAGLAKKLVCCAEARGDRGDTEGPHVAAAGPRTGRPAFTSSSRPLTCGLGGDILVKWQGGACTRRGHAFQHWQRTVDWLKSSQTRKNWSSLSLAHANAGCWAWSSLTCARPAPPVTQGQDRMKPASIHTASAVMPPARPRACCACGPCKVHLSPLASKPHWCWQSGRCAIPTAGSCAKPDKNV